MRRAARRGKRARPRQPAPTRCPVRRPAPPVATPGVCHPPKQAPRRCALTTSRQAEASPSTSMIRVAPRRCSRSRRGVSYAISRVLRMAMRSARSSASARLCVDTSTARPSARKRPMRSRTCRALAGSRPEVGSSSSTTGGSCTRARAMATRCFSPLESAPGTIVRAIVDADVLHDGRHAPVLVRHTVQAGIGEEVGADRQPLPQPGRFREQPDPAPHLVRGVGRQRSPGDHHLAARRQQQRREHADVVVLPAPFGPSRHSTSPACTESVRSSTAGRPSKLRLKPDVRTTSLAMPPSLSHRPAARGSEAWPGWRRRTSRRPSGSRLR